MAIRSAGLIEGLTAMVGRVKASISKKFRAFYLKRVHEVDLAPTKTFSFEFDIASPSQSSHRRSLAKLKALVVKDLLKNNPVVALAATEFIPIENASNQVRFNMFEVDMGPTMPAVNEKIFKAKLRENRLDDRSISAVTAENVIRYDRMGRAVIESSKQYLSLLRYTQYLEYLARKSGVPVMFRLQYNRQDVLSGGTSVKYNVLIEVTFAGWIANSNEAETRYRRVLAGESDDSLFHVNNWVTSNIDYLPPESKFHIARFFLHLDKALQVVNTLTRKIDYGYNAFIFRTA